MDGAGLVPTFLVSGVPLLTGHLDVVCSYAVTVVFSNRARLPLFWSHLDCLHRVMLVHIEAFPAHMLFGLTSPSCGTTYWCTVTHPGHWQISERGKPVCLHALLACHSWQQEAVLLSSSHMLQPFLYLCNCYSFWETAWPHNQRPVKGDQEPRRCQRKIHKQAEKHPHVHQQRETCQDRFVARYNGSVSEIVAVCVNTSGQYNFTDHHLHTCTLPFLSAP